MRFLALIFGLTFLLTACSQASQGSSLSSEEATIRAVLSPLSVRGIELKEIRPVEEIKVPGFKVFEVTLLDKANSREVKRYVFISSDGRYLALELFEVNREGKRVYLKPVGPKEPVRKLKVDISWVKEIDRKLTAAKIPHVIGSSSKKIYIVWDSMCPFCYRHFKDLARIAKENRVVILMLPFPIH